MVFTWYWSIFKIASFRVSALDGFKTTAWCLRESIFSRSRGKKESYTKIILNDKNCKTQALHQDEVPRFQKT